jgi:deazaflavin-dependent oxidoreductase (nitroreductase family)
MPSDFSLKSMNAIHKALLTLTGGHLGWKFFGMTALELTTTGRKSGQPRTVMLTSPLQVDDAIVIVASRGGDDFHPGWFHNLTANPDVTVSFGGKPKRAMRARVASADEKSTLWPRVTAAYKGYGDYQKKTERDIPLVLLEPVPTPSA